MLITIVDCMSFILFLQRTTAVYEVISSTRSVQKQPQDNMAPESRYNYSYYMQKPRTRSPDISLIMSYKNIKTK